MERRALVLDANILIRAVLGQQVRRIIEAHADNVSFFIPEAVYAEAEEHLARLVAKHGGDPTKAMAFLISMPRSGLWSAWTSIAISQPKRGSGSMHAIRTTGRFSQPPLLSAVRSGLRTRTSSAVASQRGRPLASTASWRNSARLPFGLTSFGRECTGALDIAGARFELYGPNEPSESHWVLYHCSSCRRS
jgi:hypothetical protein